MNNTNQEFKPIRCPVCGSVELAFVTEYHKCIGKRIIFAILTAATLVFMLLFISNTVKEIWFTLFLGLSTAACYIAIMLDENKTHVQAICQHCGHLWLLN